MKINTSAVRRLCLLTLTVLCVTVSRASTYIVAVGINNYKYVTSLTVSEDDARAFAQMCKSYPDLHVALVTGSKATRANLIDVIGSHFAKAKAVLHLATERIITECPSAEYFPAYEIVCDQLRDYRFYDRDLKHPSSMAIDIIYDFFFNTYFDKDTRQRAMQYRAERLKALHCTIIE